MSTAICERGFSALKRIKSDRRSSLCVEMLDRLKVIVLEGPSLEDYHPAGATSKWWKGHLLRTITQLVRQASGGRAIS